MVDSKKMYNPTSELALKVTYKLKLAKCSFVDNLVTF